jgi:hypothetical protein
MYETLPLETNTIHPDEHHNIDCITVDPEFRNLIPAISTEEREYLERNIVDAGGVRDPLTLWLRSDDDWVILDGHNRFEICQRLKLPFPFHQVEFDTREQAADWIDRNQLGRRNLSKQDYKLLLGRRYNRAKRQGERTDLTSGQNAQKSTTAEKLAKEHGVDEKTVRRAGKYQKAAETLGVEKDIAAGTVKASEVAVIEAAETLPDNPTPAQVKQARESLPKGGQSKGKTSSPPKASASRAKNHKLAHKITIELMNVRRHVETLAQTDSAYRQEALRELQSCIGHLTRGASTDTAKPAQHRPDDELRAAVGKRWESMRLWDAHWALADMDAVRKLFIEIIREEQKQVGK